MNEFLLVKNHAHVWPAVIEKNMRAHFKEYWLRSSGYPSLDPRTLLLYLRTLELPETLGNSKYARELQELGLDKFKHAHYLPGCQILICIFRVTKSL
jgi:hypothetical protein